MAFLTLDFGNGKENKVRGLLAEYGQAVEELETLLASPTLVAAQSKADGLKAQIGKEVKTIGATVKGEGYQAVYSPEGVSVSWNDDALLGFATEHPAILGFRTERVRAASVSVRKVK